MMHLAFRRSDRAYLGNSGASTLGDDEIPTAEEWAQANIIDNGQAASLSALVFVSVASNSPHARAVVAGKRPKLNADLETIGAITTWDDPAPPPPPDPQLAADHNLVASFMTAASGTATAVQRDDVTKAILRRMGRDA